MSDTPRITTPDPLSEQIEETVSDLFAEGHLDPGLVVKCRYQYVYAKIQQRQKRNKDIPDGLKKLYNDLEEELEDRGFTPHLVRRVGG